MCLLGLGLGYRPRVVRMLWQYPDTQQGQQARQTTIRLAKGQQASMETMGGREDVIELATDT